MKILFLIICILLATTLAGATSFTNGELIPIPKGGYTFATTGPTEPIFGKDVWIHLNGEKWQPVDKGNGIFHWNANIFYSPFDNAKVEFYYFVSGNEHSMNYPQVPSQTPIPPSLLMLVTGLVGLVGFRRKVK